MKVKVQTMIRRGKAMYTNGKIVECSERDGAGFLKHGLAVKAPEGAKADGSFLNSGRPERATVPKGEVTDPGTEPARCTARTKKGNPCARYAIAGSDTCDRHAD